MELAHKPAKELKHIGLVVRKIRMQNAHPLRLDHMMDVHHLLYLTQTLMA